MEQSYICKIIYKNEIAKGIIDMKVQNADMAEQCKCGQFLHIDCGSETFLRRPISICDVCEDVVRFVFQIKGKGTEELARFGVGDEIDILGPLGNTFRLHYEDKKPVVIGGGIGTFPLLFLCKSMETKPVVALGFRTAELVVMEDEFREVSSETVVYTDDGTYGKHGFAVETLKEKLEAGECDMIYACGPKPMLKIIKEMAEKYGVRAQISLEERMGCGIGACLSCACKVNTGEGYRHVCKHGPIFMASDVEFE